MIQVTDKYWQQFMHTVRFEVGKPVEGVLEARNSDGPRNDPYPVLVLRTPQGWKLRLNVTQVRLLSELMKLRPDIGDTVRIVYTGDADKAPAGLNPAKEFEVTVTRKDPPAAAS